MLIQSLSMLCFLFGLAQDGGGKPKSDPMDLRLDIERRKKYCTQEKQPNRGREKKHSSRETSLDKSSKCHKSSKYAHVPSTLVAI